jgi:microcystin-dependent protein
MPTVPAILGEIRLVSFNYAPAGWAECNGQLLPINQNQALFSLFGTTYGGNGQTTFALPDLRGRTPIHFGSGFTLGERAGETAHTLSLADAHSRSVWEQRDRHRRRPGRALLVERWR